MSDAAANKAILEQVYRRWHETRGGSLNEFFEIFADEILWGSLAHGAAPVAFTAQARGKSEVRGYFNGLLEGWHMVYYRVHHFIAEGERVVMVGATAWTNKATGKTCDTPKVDIWRFQNGRAIEFFEFYDTAGLLAAAT